MLLILCDIIKNMNSKELFKWYEKNHRKLKFRETKNPYHIWISEVMLQQTQVDTVLPYFSSFIEKYPDVKTLAKTDLETVLKSVEGLGYYRRFRNMHKAAVYIHENLEDIFPSTYKDLLKLPGIGRYTAGAIMSIAYDQPYSALDGNVIRVLTRYFNIDWDMSLEKNRKLLDQKNQEIIENMPSANIYTQSMMEIGALVCRPTETKCMVCPFKDECLGYKNNNALEYPISLKKIAKVELTYFVFIVTYHTKYVLRKRTEKLLEGFYEFLQVESESLSEAIESLEKLGISIKNPKYSKKVKHVFTHQFWSMEVYEAVVNENPEPEYYLIDDLEKIPIAIAHRKII
ncbi:A/G-specific adenine DNA glycosylase [Alteracholeplasma palmae J233]|uniref:Adenine DNA glycosylase n=1 Tax=Alteracholeplasma palmae (strain ATCC 49389 / J233) TaxID=1318466 RepID=U4KKW1_ALTPJ|nr:A/G-specific adenine glycosylase [Alteracholeplasma palmae]CCV64439.1 A/G-specific adenine DNA glycosylase [Alteracholeplasma palmae J233]